MKVELFLKKINQEMINAGKKPSRRPSVTAETRWVVSWPKSCCILDFSIAGRQEEISLAPTRGLIMRSEDVGGMFWNPRSGEVYKVDEEAYHAMLELDRGFSEMEVARRMNTSIRKIKSLTSQLKRITQ